MIAIWNQRTHYESAYKRDEQSTSGIRSAWRIHIYGIPITATINDVDFTHVLHCIFGWPDRNARLVGSSASTLDDQPIKSYLEPKSKTRTIRPFLDLPPGRSSEFPPQIAFARPMIDREV